MKKQGKKLMLVALVLLALVTVALPLVGCKNDTVSEQTGGGTGSGVAHTHSYGDWEVKTESTDKIAGKLVKKCTVCRHEGTETKDIPVGFVYVKGGTVDGTEMQDGVFKGCKVTLSDFFIGKYEVTQEEYASVMANQKVKVNETEYTLNANPSEFQGDSKPPAEGEDPDQRPVEKVSWYDAVYFCNALSGKEGLTKAYTITDITVTDGSISSATVDLVDGANGYRLPTEAEWEYAARGGKPSAVTTDPWNYQWAGTDKEDKLEDYAWYMKTPNVGDTTHEVGTKTANSLGLYDMSGNVWEWCWDWHNDDPKEGDTGGESPVTAPTGSDEGFYRVSRGGSWGTLTFYCGVSVRRYYKPYDRSNFLGFRVVRPAK